MKVDPRILDAYYTPEAVARELVSHLPAGVTGAVMDPTVGDGALLRAVHSRYEESVTLLGIDVNGKTVRNLRRERPDWCLSQADCLKSESRLASKAWRLARADLDVVVMNPPFSHRGGGGAWVEFGDFAGHVAPAVHFLTELISNLNPRHGFYAILPDGALRAERHEKLWAEIEKSFEVRVLAKLRTSLFAGARVSTSIIHLKSGRTIRNEPAVLQSKNNGSCRCVDIVRGRVPVHKARTSVIKDPVPFIHTSAIGAAQHPQSSDLVLSDTTPFVLISRVGSWRSPRTLEIGPVVLSDCVIAIRPTHRPNLTDLFEDIVEHESLFLDALRGTGAQYLTLRALTECLQKLGWQPRISRSGVAPTPCLCAAETRVIYGSQ
ncbi:N-6 DNA methylase [Pseudoclavibacter sp. RFBB5]|uniref:N-6 DNA methylase n=1 Tax=Pseudoclavibacter sp. RFBB5 TaxID=2080574 RepID=UPI0015E221D2